LVFRFGCVAHARIYFSERFCLPRWLRWHLALCYRLLCFVRLTALPPLGFCPLRVRFRSVLPWSCGCSSPLHFEIFAALPWSWRCARRCTSRFSPRCRGAGAALAVALRNFAALPWSCRCARRCISSFSLSCRGAAAALARAAPGFFVAPPLASVLPRRTSVRCALPPQFFPCGF
jgi:hypothetical protein